LAISIGLIGVTGYGQVHLEQILSLQQMGRVRLSAVTVNGPGDLQSIPEEVSNSGIPLYTNYKDMLHAHGGRLDLCCIPTPIHLHSVMSVDCLRAGAHILVEKPLAGSIEECRMIRRVQQETGLTVAVGFQNVYDPSSCRIKERLLNGAIGPIRRMSGYGLSPRSLKYYNRNLWAGKLHVDGHPVLDSPVNNAMAHYLQWLLFIGGSDMRESLRPVRVESEMFRANPIEGPDTVNLRVSTEEDIDLRFVVSHASDVRVPVRLAIDGEQGSITWREDGDAEIKTRAGEAERIPIPSHREMQMRLVERVIAYLETGNGIICTPEHAEMHTRCVVGGHVSGNVGAIPECYVGESPFEGWPLRHIAGIQEAVREAAMKDLSFHALGIPWAVSPPALADVCPVMLT
jgi:predicted dehydrogenase